MFYSYIHDMNQIPSSESLMKEILYLREQLKVNQACIQGTDYCIIDSVGVSVVTTDANENIKYLNKKAEEIYNISLKDVIGKPFTQVLPTSITKKEKEEIHQAFNKGKSWQGDFEVYNPNGKVLTIHTVDTPIIDYEGEYQGMICVAYDMTEKKEADKALFESEEKYRNVINNTIEGIFIVQGESIVYSNSRALEMMGYSENEAFTRRFQEFISSDDLKKVMENYKERLSGKKLEPYDLRLLKKNNETLWVSLNATLINWNSQTAILCFITDISYRKQKEEELKNYNATLKAMIENAVDFIMVADVEGKPVMYNENYKNIIESNLDIEMKPGIQPHKIQTDKNIEKYWDTLHKRVLGGESFKEQIELIIDNEERFFEFSYVPLIEDDKVLGFCEYSREITDTKKYEEELKKAKEKAEESDRLKSAFLANMSHEIRTPMNGIIGFSDLLIRPDLTKEKYTLYADTLRNSCYQLLNIVNDILDISRIETGQVVVKKEDVCINKMLRELFKIYEPSAKAANLKLFLKCELNDEEAVINTDVIRLRQVLTNLIGNALKYTSKGHIKFGYLKENDHLKFFVEDTGIGIEEDMHNVIFERFRQADVSLAKKFSGTGLGLSISKGFVRILGGEIGVTSEPDKGSYFYFTHPYSSKKVKIPAIEKLKIREGLKTEKSLLILVAEDEEINFLLMKEVIGTNLKNTIIIRAKDGNEAVKMVDEFPDIDVIFMDIKMPNMNGYEASRLIKKLRPDIPIVAVTAYAMPEDRKKSEDAGCKGYISKPISAEELFDVVEGLIRK